PIKAQLADCPYHQVRLVSGNQIMKIDLPFADLNLKHSDSIEEVELRLRTAYREVMASWVAPTFVEGWNDELKRMDWFGTDHTVEEADANEELVYRHHPSINRQSLARRME